MKMIAYALLIVSMSCAVSHAALLACKQSQVTECLAPFQTQFANGVAELKEANDTVLSVTCMKYDVVSSCLAPLMYYCPEIKQQLKSRLEDFEYACTATRSGANWPFKPTFEPSKVDENINEEIDAQERLKVIDSAIKASIAAAVTVLLVLICVIADCTSKCKIKRRVKAQMAASTAAQQQAQEPLMEKQAIEEENEAMEENVKKV